MNGVRGVVTKGGFGDGAVSSASKGSAGVVKPGGFETAAAGTAAPKPQKADAPAPVQPVVILATPHPAYSEEARKLGLEGEVLVEVVFLAKGGVRVLRVAQGLGHGLDEAAVRAAEQIQFKPALQDGKPVDFLATVHIQFELAF
jgi:TonB family protein